MVTKQQMKLSAGFGSLSFQTIKMPQNFCDIISPVKNIPENNKMSLPEFPVQVIINYTIFLQQIQVNVIFTMYICDNCYAVFFTVRLSVFRGSNKRIAQVIEIVQEAELIFKIIKIRPGKFFFF